jgi:MFS family permease
MTPSPRTLAPVYALLAGTAIFLLGNGLLSTLTPVRADIQNFSSFWIGWIGAGYFGGFIVGCYVCPPLVSRVGHIRVFAALAAAASTVPLLQVMVIHPGAWVCLRAVIGFCLAGLYMVIESWLNDIATRATRGSIFGAYMIINLAAMAAGQYLLVIADPAKEGLFLIVAILIAFALIPVALTRASAPPPPVQASPRLGRLYRLSPVGLVGCVVVGMANGSFWSLSAVYARDVGLSYAGIAVFVSAAIVGGTLIQWPLGKISDTIGDRRKLIAVVSGCASLFSIALVFGKSLPGPSLFGAAFLFGAAVFSLYGLCVAHANDYAEPADFVQVSAGLLLTFGAGATVGPIIASALMEVAGDAYLFAFTAVAQGAMAAYVLHRVRRREPVEPEAREQYVATTRTSPEAFALDPRSQEAPHTAE